MELLQLPPETLVHIFSYIGSSYFRSDLSRLIISKQWLTFAETACFQDFHITQPTLQRLQSSPCIQKNLHLLKSSAQSLKIDLQGFDDWDAIPINIWNRDQGMAIRTAWTAELNAQLLGLATLLTQSHKLRKLCVKAISELHPLWPSIQRRDYLYLSTIRAFLSTGNLTHLDLDLCGTRLINDEEEDQRYNDQGEEEPSHICPTIASLLRTLHSLRLRMRSICPLALTLPPQQPQTQNKKIPLHTLLVNLSLSNESPLTTSASHSLPCTGHPAAFLTLKSGIEDQAAVLVSQMENPRMVRVLVHSLPGIEMVALDVLTGALLGLGVGGEWDAEGVRVVEEEGSDEESEIESLDWEGEGGGSLGAEEDDEDEGLIIHPGAGAG